MTQFKAKHCILEFYGIFQFSNYFFRSSCILEDLPLSGIFSWKKNKMDDGQIGSMVKW